MTLKIWSYEIQRYEKTYKIYKMKLLNIIGTHEIDQITSADLILGKK